MSGCVTICRPSWECIFRHCWLTNNKNDFCTKCQRCRSKIAACIVFTRKRYIKYILRLQVTRNMAAKKHFGNPKPQPQEYLYLLWNPPKNRRREIIARRTLDRSETAGAAEKHGNLRVWRTSAVPVRHSVSLLSSASSLPPLNLFLEIRSAL